MKVVIATDGHESSLHAIRSAIRLLPLRSAEVWVVSVMDPEERIGANENADEDLTEAHAILAEAGIEAKSAMRRGHFAEQIVAEASALDADLIVVGSSARRPFMQWLSGSVSAEVIHRWKGAVLVVGHH